MTNKPADDLNYIRDDHWYFHKNFNYLYSISAEKFMFPPYHF